MSYPATRPDRRLFSRQRCAQSCVLEFGRGESAPAILRQLDPRGARVRILGKATPTGAIRIVTPEGVAMAGATVWRIGDVIGIQRRGGTPDHAEPHIAAH